MKQTYQKRVPSVVTRDPVIAMRGGVPNIPTLPPVPKKRVARRFIAASAPVVCPACGGKTRMDDGRHVDPVRRMILEYRTCVRCGALLAAGRAMVAHEVAQLCSRADAVREYEESVR